MTRGLHLKKSFGMKKRFKKMAEVGEWVGAA